MTSTAPAIQFRVDGVPKGQPRPRAFVRGGHAAVYDPGTAEGWKSCIAVAAKPHIPPTPLAGTIALTVEFIMPRPRAHFRTGKHASELRGDAPEHHCSRPDVDNLTKAVLDALTDIGMWIDDAQIALLGAVKLYGVKPGANIEIHQVRAAEIDKEKSA